jgi:hypothetical protein
MCLRLQATDCTNAVRIKDAFDKNSFCTEVACADGHLWCFNCKDEPHAPAGCSQIKDWRKKCAVGLHAKLGECRRLFLPRTARGTALRAQEPSSSKSNV